MDLVAQFNQLQGKDKQDWLDQLSVKELSQLELELFILPKFDQAADGLKAAIYSGNLLAIVKAFWTLAQLVNKVCDCLLAGAVPPPRY